jgi:effector-binding domain-containing protein
MKILKWLLYIVLFIVALVLIIPLLLPATVEVSSQKEIMVSPAQVFHNAASYTDRNVWDPWLETEPEAEYTLESQPDYVGSTYTWNGKKIRTGRMVVDSVSFGKYIASSIYFGDDPEPARVEWNLEKSEEGTNITWKFKADGKYPMGRLMLNMMKGSMKKSFEKGLDNLKAYLEENPPVLSSLAEITTGKIGPINALMLGTRGTMEEVGMQMEQMLTDIMSEIDNQGLQIAGAPFSHYLSYDQETGIAELRVGIPTTVKGESSGDIESRSYPEMEALMAVHSGPYDELSVSYGKLMEYIEANQVEVAWESFEFYHTDPESEPNVTKWKTLIAFPMK